MTRYLVRRTGVLLVVLLGIVAVTFGLLRVAPGDPARLIAGPDAPPETVMALRHELGLDRPMAEQFVLFVGQVVRGDLGQSFQTGRPVLEEIGWRYVNTGILALTAVGLASLAGIAAGMLAARYPYSAVDSAIMSGALAGVSAPVFWLGLLLMWLFAVKLRWLPTSGAGSLRHLILPAITLGAALTATIARMTRSSLLEVIEEDYIRTARAYGVAERSILLRHALRNAFLPILTVIGLQLGYSLAGAVLTESVFAWPGMGRLIAGAIFTRDYPVVQAGLLVVAVTFAAINFAVDVLYAWLDPRIRYD
ncbi:ABC transporter permease [Carboxydochorda subterranea]|uniref:ABC transporter permease n=1 Tax=Carboxydichorda subterranea TaxID=3109565 RepID=A0ABZ1BYY1_9FIRM|nr:ABC transporter permease [Limnochorda sp. L945t]WRP17931.1 ABC transporter permease [Limnochorda sp. L945t]